MKKKFLLYVVVGGLLLALGTAGVQAVSRPGGQDFVDADGDGVCDNRTLSVACPQDGTGRQLGKTAGEGGNRWGRGR